MNRIINVARMQLINKWTFIGIPLVILFGAFLFTMAIFWLVRLGGGTEVMFSGGAQAPMWYFLALGIQSLTMTFPFSLAMSVSRRTFFLGTLMLFAVSALALSAFYYVMGLIETATNGWGLGGRFFALDWVANNNAFIQIMFYFVLMVLLFITGFWAATIYMRWRTTGLLIFFIVLGVALLGAAFYLTLAERWGEVWSWMVTWSAGGIALWGGVIALAMAAASYTTLRKATA
ncbi:hypothetical protein [Glutamicibacter uratoxydans]|uniref:hypothetical protein n=1 Tax=Glutamicibacter uratoxydans TaxID=43667 RepID=UPI003D6F88DA